MREDFFKKAFERGISRDLMEKILDQAEAEYPKECCGLITGVRGGSLNLRPFRNAQDDAHARDPENFPRTSKNAYWIDPKDLLALHKQLRSGGEEILVIYHSHIDAGAYFSEEDVSLALLDGSPAYPGAVYLVISVKSGRTEDVRFYAWNKTRGKFLA